MRATGTADEANDRGVFSGKTSFGQRIKRQFTTNRDVANRFFHISGRRGRDCGRRGQASLRNNALQGGVERGEFMATRSFREWGSDFCV